MFGKLFIDFHEFISGLSFAAWKHVISLHTIKRCRFLSALIKVLCMIYSIYDF